MRAALRQLPRGRFSAEDWLALETRVVNPTDPAFAEKSAAMLQAFYDRAAGPATKQSESQA